jgi:hypothetical protein
MAAPKPGGFKMSLGALKMKPGLKSSPAQKDTKKKKLLLGDDEPDDSNTQQEITGWDAAEGGAVDANRKEKEGPRIIPALPNRDWRAEARRKQLAKAPHEQAQNATVDESQMEEPKVHYGLTIIKKDEAQENGAAEAEAEAPEPMEVEQDNLTEEQRLEKKALDALISGKSTDNDLVIPVQTEEETFLNDLHNAPDAPTLEAYEATPIEGFGAALLRGMGWKDGDGKNGAAAKPKEIKRRPALLGIGAKEDAAIGVELGEWGGGKSKGKKAAQTYNPVTLRNKRTGEIITEEELKAKLESQTLIQDEKPSRSKSKYDDNSEEDERRREKRKEKRDDRDRRRDDDYDSERRKDKDRRRDKDDYYDSDRRRDKRRDRARDDDYDSERRREKRRERSRSPDDRKEKRRNRYRSRSRDSKRKSDRRDRSRSRDSDDRRKRRRDGEYEDEGRYEKKKYRDEKYYK